MNSIVELILEIKKKPSMYLATKTISNLKSFLDGWAGRDYETIGDLGIMMQFQDWVEEKYNLKSTQSWNKILLFYSYDESTALQLFFEEFDTFLSSIHYRIE